MVRSPARTNSLLTFSTLAGALVVAFGCSREPGEPTFPVPWNQADHDLGRCVGACQVDLGPRPLTQADCDRQEEGLEFFPEPVWDFETLVMHADPVTGMSAMLPSASLAYAYQDNTTEFLMTSADETCTIEKHADEGEDTNCQAGYQPTTVAVDRCGSAHAWHIRGGPFREWGGGIGRRLDNMAKNAAVKLGSDCSYPPPATSNPSEPAFCPEYQQRIADAPGVDYVQPATDTQPERVSHVDMNELVYYQMQVDLREWEGISFWARRGPDSQPGIRLGVQDRQLDDDISFQESGGGVAPVCRRNKECDCRNHRPCRPGLGGVGFYCWDPALDLSPVDQQNPWSHDPYRCGITECDHPYSAYPSQPDPEFYTPERDDRFVGTASCSTFTFKNDITRDQCFDVKDGPAPAESADKCGDPWITPVRLSGDWAFYKIPFTELRQEGYGKEFYAIDLAGITSVRFTWAVGWLDVWIDDVRIYRRK